MNWRMIPNLELLKRRPSHSLHARQSMITPLIMPPSSEALSSKSKCMKSFLTQSVTLQVQEVICIMLFGRKGCNYAVQHYSNQPYKLVAHLIHHTAWPTCSFEFLLCTPLCCCLAPPTPYSLLSSCKSKIHQTSLLQ